LSPLRQRLSVRLWSSHSAGPESAPFSFLKPGFRMSFLFHRRQASAPQAAPVTDRKPGNVVAVLVHKAFVGGTIRRADFTIDSAYSLFTRHKAILPSVDKTNILAFFRK
jgi:hypothetical protein